MTAGQSGAERGDVWDHNTAQHDWEFAGNFPEKTVSRVTFYDAHETYIRGHRKGYERGYAAGEAAQADSGIWLSNEEAALVMDYMAWDREVLEPIRAKLEPSWTKHHHIGEAPDPAALAPKKADPAP